MEKRTWLVMYPMISFAHIARTRSRMCERKARGHLDFELMVTQFNLAVGVMGRGRSFEEKGGLRGENWST